MQEALPPPPKELELSHNKKNSPNKLWELFCTMVVPLTWQFFTPLVPLPVPKIQTKSNIRSNNAFIKLFSHSLQRHTTLQYPEWYCLCIVTHNIWPRQKPDQEQVVISFSARCAVTLPNARILCQKWKAPPFQNALYCAMSCCCYQGINSCSFCQR